MTLNVRVSWPHAGHVLLSEKLADVRLTIGGSPIPLAASSAGVRQFEIPDGTPRVVLTASFSASFGTVVRQPDLPDAPPMSAEVLRIEQPFDVVDGGTALRAADMPEYVKGHPLVDTKVLSNVHGAALLQLRTEFVDITPFWNAYYSFASQYAADHAVESTGTELVALGYTGGDPKIWFASVPAACIAPPRPALSSLVFFRPAAQTYDRIDQKHAQAGLNRFLLKPTDQPANFRKRDIFKMDLETNTVFTFLRCGFEDALARSGKAVVMLHPWPSGLAYGDAVGPELPRLAEAALRLLWANQVIAKNRGAIRLGRLGLAGYSAGGGALWGCLGANAGRVDEVFSFDTVGTADAAPRAIQWFRSRPTACLRMTGAFQLTANQGIARSIEKLQGGPQARVTAVPADASAYAAGNMALWDHVLTELPELRSDGAARHQFAMFGGHPTLPGAFAKTFLQRFLEDSDL